ncbi:MAG: hypothetical protein M1827_001939 [Pycnora praestabilis]|nr:MAG: hypothetical protein M1827_001939 [Pycnora praestabilis]
MKSSIIAACLFILLSTAAPVEVVQRDLAIAAVEGEVAKRQGYSDTQNDVTNNAPCKAVTIIFARGTTELGNVGSVAGPPFFNALGAEIGSNNVAVQGVPYAASVAGYLEGGDPAGASALASLTSQALSQCPNTQIVLSGYSQGAQEVHLGAKQLSTATASKIAAVVLFGDPDDGQPIQDVPTMNVDTFCFSGDLICDGLPIVDPEHLAYSVDAVPAADFVAQHVTV